MQTYTLQIEDSAVEKFMWVLEHFNDVIKIDKSATLQDELWVSTNATLAKKYF